MKMNKKKNLKKSEKGFAILEAIAFLMIFVILVAYVIDFFTVIHSGIVNSIAARTYLFETFQHRSKLVWLRYDSKDKGPRYRYTDEHERFHAVTEEFQDANDDQIRPSARTLTQVKNDVTEGQVNDFSKL